MHVDLRLEYREALRRRRIASHYDVPTRCSATILFSEPEHVLFRRNASARSRSHCRKLYDSVFVCGVRQRDGVASRGEDWCGVVFDD